MHRVFFMLHRPCCSVSTLACRYSLQETFSWLYFGTEDTIQEEWDESMCSAGALGFEVHIDAEQYENVC